MSTLTAALCRELEQLLNEECALNQLYRSVVREERDNFRKFQHEGVLRLCEQRGEIARRMGEIQERRVAIMYTVAGETLPAKHFKPGKLSELVAKHASPQQAAILLPLIRKLREEIQSTRRESLEFGQIATFTLALVNGLLSNIWSATQNVVKTYTARGQKNEAYHPQSSRQSSVIKRV